MTPSLKFVLPLLMGILFSGCYYDNEESLYANYKNPGAQISSCDTVNLTYTRQIKAILDANCILCHYTGSGHAAILDSVTAVMSAAAIYNLYNNATNSNHQGNVNLDNCSKTQLRIWSLNPVQ